MFCYRLKGREFMLEIKSGIRKDERRYHHGRKQGQEEPPARDRVRVCQRNRLYGCKLLLISNVHILIKRLREPGSLPDSKFNSTEEIMPQWGREDRINFERWSLHWRPGMEGESILQTDVDLKRLWLLKKTGMKF
jgi:hypothetical protein